MLSVAVAMLLTPLAHMQAQDGTRAAITAVADEFDRAQLAKDVTALRRMVADGVIFIDGSGTRRDKEAFLAGWTIQLIASTRSS